MVFNHVIFRLVVAEENDGNGAYVVGKDKLAKILIFSYQDTFFSLTISIMLMSDIPG
jgi:hypothetical protein